MLPCQFMGNTKFLGTRFLFLFSDKGRKSQHEQQNLFINGSNTPFAPNTLDFRSPFLKQYSPVIKCFHIDKFIIENSLNVTVSNIWTNEKYAHALNTKPTRANQQKRSFIGQKEWVVMPVFNWRKLKISRSVCGRVQCPRMF